ncbi:hypothetical protein N7470_000654 [Penicillium chermesinum]|nr:hypothetical protein N7470_000654 [Penicillium chermesinum]
MDVYESSSGSLIQTVRDGMPALTWTTFLAVLVFSCVATRVITGLQSHQRTSGTEARRAQLAPYWIPWIGHGASFLWDHVSFFESLRETMKESVFRVYIRGEIHDTVLSPSMIKTIMSSPDASKAPVLDQALQNVFGDRGLLRNLRANRDHEISDDVASLIDREPFATEHSEAITKFLKRNIASLVTFCRSPVDQTPWERDSQVKLFEDDQSVCLVDLYSLIRSFVGHNITQLLIGESFVESFQGFLTYIWTLDDNFVPMFVGIPRSVPTPGVSSGFAARDNLLHIMSVFYRAFNAWDDGIDPGIELRDLEDVSELFKQRMRTFRKLGLSPGASAAGNLSLYWDLLGHSARMTFWNVVHIFADSELLKEIRKEISPYVKAIRLTRRETGFPMDEPPTLDMDMEKMLQFCPLLKASYYETIRLHSAGISFRKLESDITLTESTADAVEPRTYKLRKGEKVIMPMAFIGAESGNSHKVVNAEALGPMADGLYASKHNSFTERTILGFTAAIVSMWDLTSPDGKSITVPGNRTTWGAFSPTNNVRAKVRMAV